MNSVVMDMPLGLAGRERELEKLLEAWRSCRLGETRGRAISGVRGSGKTALLRELRRRLQGESRFVAVRCVAGETPYGPLLRALRPLLQQLLMAKEQSLRGHRRKLRRALGSGGRQLAGLLPELAVLLGEARGDSRQYLPAGAAARSQLEDQLLRLLRALGDSPIPLALGFDDLHLADPVLLRWLALLLRSPRPPSLLLIVTRAESPQAGAPVLAAVERAWEELSGQLETLRLGPLGKDAVRRQLVVADGLTAEASEELAARLHQMSGGHPQALGELLRALIRADALRLTPGRACWQGEAWRSALERAAEHPSAAADRMELLPQQAQELLGVLSLLGDEAGLSLVAAAAGVSEEQAQRGLELATAAGLLIRRVRADGSAWRFAEEAVRRTAASGLAEAAARAIHRRAADWLLRTGPERPVGERLRALLRHLHACMGDEGMPDARQLAAWNRQAGEEAVWRCDYGAALGYLRFAERLLQASGTHAERYEAALARLAMEHIAGSPGEAARLAGQLWREARDVGERARLFIVEMRQHAYADRRSAAIARGLELLAELGVSVEGASAEDAPGDEMDIVAGSGGMTAVGYALRAERDELVFAVEEMKRAEHAATGAGVEGPGEETWIVEVLMATAAAAGYADQRLLARLLEQAVRLSVRSRRTSGAAIEAYAGYAGLLLWTVGDAGSAAALAARAVELASEQDDMQVKANVYGAVYPLYARLMPPRERHHFLRQAARSASATGVAHADSVATTMRASSYYLSGNLRALARYLRWQQARIARDGWQEDPYLSGVMGLYRAFLDGMQDEHGGLYLPDLPCEVQELPEYPLLQGQYSAMKVQLCMLLGRPDEALQLAAASQAAVGMAPMLPHEPEYWLYTGLAAGAAAERGTLELALGRLAVWAERAPANYAYKHHLLLGDLARLDGVDARALEQYEIAMQEGRAQRNYLLSAIAAVRAAEQHSLAGRMMSAALLSAAAAEDSRRAGAYALAGRIRQAWQEQWRSAGVLLATDSRPLAVVGRDDLLRRGSDATSDPAPDAASCAAFDGAPQPSVGYRAPTAHDGATSQSSTSDPAPGAATESSGGYRASTAHEGAMSQSSSWTGGGEEAGGLLREPAQQTAKPPKDGEPRTTGGSLRWGQQAAKPPKDGEPGATGGGPQWGQQTANPPKDSGSGATGGGPHWGQQATKPLKDGGRGTTEGSPQWGRQVAAHDADLTSLVSSGWPLGLGELVQASGATRALLVVRHEAGLDTAACWDASEPGDPSSRDEPAGLLRLAERTGEPVVLEDEAALAPFSADPYLRQRAPSAAAVLPVTDLGRVIGYLYLECASDSLTLPPREVWELPAAQAIRERTAARVASIGESRPAERLTPREREVLALTAEGLSNREAAARLGLAEGTVKIHLNRIYDKLGVKRRTQAIERARKLGLL